MYDVNKLFFSTAGSFLVLLFWRIRKFHLKPSIHPEDPKELPYWIPRNRSIRFVQTRHVEVMLPLTDDARINSQFIGHTIRFTKNSFSLLHKGRKYFGNTGEPFAITIAGQSIYILTSANDIEELYRNKATLSWELFVQDLYRWIGFSNNAVEKLWQPPTEQQKLLNPVRTLSHNEMVAEYQRRQLRPGKNLETLAKSIVNHISGLLEWQNLSNGQTRIRQSSEKSLNLSLIEWTTYAFIRSTTEIYWGKKIFESEPSLLQIYSTWERTSWKYVFQLSRLFSQDMYFAREKLVNAFAAYFKITQAERADVAWFVPIAEAEMRDIGLNESDLGRAHMLQHWAINGNMHKVTFWIMAHLLHSPALLEAIKEETAPGVENDLPNITYLLEHCPRLEAVYHEILRLQMSNSLMRHVTESTRIGGKVLQAGRNVLMPYRLLHYDQEVWGVNGSTFDPNRFLHRKELAQDRNYRPFGGGQHMCPGRFVAKQTIFTFVALTLSRFDVCLESRDGVDGMRGGEKGTGFKQHFPRAEDLKPGLATLGPRKGDDVFVRCSLRVKA